MARALLAGPANLLLVEQEMSRPKSVSFAAGTALVHSAPCPERGRANEDGLAVIPFGEAGGVLAVADGLGGQPAGARAAKIALECLAASLEEARRDGGHGRGAILDGMERANHAVQALGIGAGTTLTVAEIGERTARAYQVGDSEVLIVGQRGKLRFRSVPQSPVGYGVEAGLIAHDEALEHEDRHLLSNLVGTPEMRIEIGPVVQLRPRDVVLLASDGLFDNLHGEEIIETIRKGKLRTAARRLARVSAGRMTVPAEGEPSKPDDLTFILYRGSAD